MKSKDNNSETQYTITDSITAQTTSEYPCYIFYVTTRKTDIKRREKGSFPPSPNPLQPDVIQEKSSSVIADKIYLRLLPKSRNVHIVCINVNDDPKCRHKAAI